MHIATIVLSILLALAFLAIGGPKALALESATRRTVEMGLDTRMMRLTGILEVAAVVGLVAGLWVRWLGLAAAVGLVLLMLGALVFHARRGDPAKQMAPAAVFLVLSGALVTTGLLSQ
ncbi:hypothetical protein GCM10012275_47550 [Longimycelium tulufanense]|uniref:DoxX family protein n=1 Tax=Longimycelium tulufanense TaxID=907463 RepID=A0A8J3CFI6_9PSEU|nr:DoxX family protein [Longimycelium tulufanense]GGM71580.1 hypothetical protein GCM10012275_47550 [Longimycelium tulufanense]